jgi:hypothetical protein
MTLNDIIDLAKSLGFKTNHFLRMKDKKSGTVIAGKFTKYKQYCTDGLKIKGEDFEVDIITNGEPNFDIIQSVELTKNDLNIVQGRTTTPEEDFLIDKAFNKSLISLPTKSNRL